MKFIVWGDSKGKHNGINKKALNSILKVVVKLRDLTQSVVLLSMLTLVKH